MPDEETDVTFGDLDFDAIEAAVMETARGRWFLKEYARRNRNADTQAVLEAVDRLKEPVLDGRTMGRSRPISRTWPSPSGRPRSESAPSLPSTTDDPMSAPVRGGVPGGRRAAHQAHGPDAAITWKAASAR